MAPAWAMPAELLRQAARRLRLAAAGVVLAFAVSIVLNNLIEASGWHAFNLLAFKNVILALMVGASAAVVWFTHSGRLGPTRLLRVSLGYEIAVALAISLSDHLEPLRADVPLASISWLCVWIVIFPLVVPASPRWALVAGLASASTWPLAYFVGRALGNPAAPLHVLWLNALEGYFAVGFAMFSTIVIRSLQELGCYQLVEKLDHGGMGEIWRARHRMLARPVAVKLIRPELLGVKSPVEAASLVARFQREAEATAALHSSHTVALHDFGVTPEGAFYYVMELLDGLDLETLVRRFGPVPPERAIHLLVQACDSLAEAHATGLIHRDVKPANILTCHWGLKWDFVKVLDFGLVKSAWSHGRRRPRDFRRHDHRNPGLHGARGRARRAGDRRARRPLRARLRGLLAADGRARVRRPHAGRGADAPHQDAPGPPVRAGGTADARLARGAGARRASPRTRTNARCPPSGWRRAWPSARPQGEWTPARAHEWWDTIRTGATQTPPRADQTRTSITPPGLLGRPGS